MTGPEVSALIEDELRSWSDFSAVHLERIRRSLVVPEQIATIDRTVRGGDICDSIANAWLVFEEDPISRDGYKIVFDEERRRFGLACAGFPNDKHPVMCGWNRTFLTTLLEM